MSALEKVAYLKGLLDGLEVEDENQKKIYAALVEALDALARDMTDQLEVIDELRDMYEDLSDDYTQLDENLEVLEQDLAELYGEDDMEEEPDFDEIYESVTCPKCGHLFYYDPDAYEEGEQLECPGCGEKFDISSL